ncbi:hypothetical protein [Chromatium okenii]|nr:hypothetical protein [Chromatium okenii]
MMVNVLDGAKVRKDITIATEIGEHWKSITNGIGNYWNCNAKKETYKHLGIGMINHNDIELRKNLIDASQYLTKVDYYLSLKPIDGKRNRIFGRGEIKQQQKPKRGRKRNTTSSKVDSVK